MRPLSAVNDIARLPEFNVALFALLLNFPWEILQAPLFDGMARAPYWEAVKSCTRGTFGDAVIMLVAYWSVAVYARSRRWIVASTGPQLVLFITVGVAITVVIELLALRGLWLDGWRYSPLMPLVPGTEIGLSPLLQWIVLPPLTAWLVRRQIRGAGRDITTT